MATDLDAIANLTGASITEAQAKTWFTAMRAAMAEMGDPMGKYGAIQNLTLSVTVAGNALTIALKDRDAANPSAASPCSIPFRNVTLATGTFAVTNVIAATSLAVPDTALLGTVNSIPFRLWIVGFDDAGTFRLGVVNCLSGTNIMALKDDALYTSTSVGTGSDSAQVIYSGTGVTSKTMRVLGYAEWSTGLATAGSWSANPSKVQLFGPGVPLPGQMVQKVRSASGAVATGTGLIPYDDTIPQNTEGDQYMSQAITPTSSANLLSIDTLVNAANNQASARLAAALFQDSVANALSAGFTPAASANVGTQIRVYHEMLAATASAITFKVRAGGEAAGTTTFNGSAGGRIFGGVFGSFLSIQEIMS